MGIKKLPKWLTRSIIMGLNGSIKNYAPIRLKLLLMNCCFPGSAPNSVKSFGINSPTAAAGCWHMTRGLPAAASIISVMRINRLFSKILIFSWFQNVEKVERLSTFFKLTKVCYNSRYCRFFTKVEKLKKRVHLHPFHPVRRSSCSSIPIQLFNY